jgi:hypothetical protein
MTSLYKFMSQQENYNRLNSGSLFKPSKKFYTLALISITTLVILLSQLGLTVYFVYGFMGEHSELIKTLDENMNMLPKLSKLVDFACNSTNVC